jgi:hypothetical protein
MEGFLSMNIDLAMGIHRLTIMIMIMIMINLTTYVQNEILYSLDQSRKPENSFMANVVITSSPNTKTPFS